MLRTFFLLAIVSITCGCGLYQIFSETAAPAPVVMKITETASSPAAIPSPQPTPIFTSSPTSTPAPSPTVPTTVTPTPEPFGCLAPVEDYTRVDVNGHILNRRTLVMLEHAAAIYGGELEITGYHITQGSYTGGAEPASFGTHDGGGAVDLSVMREGTYTVLWDDVEPLVAAMRAAGFAAWLRDYGELYPGSPIHIHAVAIGDRELSFAAREQLTGTFGYFRGYTGVPVENGPPLPDRHGGPVICQWMLDAGYSDLQNVP